MTSSKADGSEATPGTPPRLGDCTWTELARATQRQRIVVLPIGSCEQHGPHLPFDTDTRIALALAAGLAAARADVLVAPAVGVSASGEHQGFIGTLSIGSAALEMMLIELVRSADWSDGVVLVNGHGGNLSAVSGAVSVLQSEGRRVLNWWPRLTGGDAHAGRTETSLMLAIAPDAVRRDAAQRGATEPIAELWGELRRGGVAAVSTNGVLGDPLGATPEEGAAILESLVGDLVERVRVWAG